MWSVFPGPAQACAPRGLRFIVLSAPQGTPITALWLLILNTLRARVVLICSDGAFPVSPVGRIVERAPAVLAETPRPIRLGAGAVCPSPALLFPH